MNMDNTSRTIPEGAPDWAFFWDSNARWGWICTQEAWAELCEGTKALGGAMWLLNGRRNRANAGLSNTFGYRPEHTGDIYLRDHAVKHGLTWMLKVECGDPFEGVLLGVIGTAALGVQPAGLLASYRKSHAHLLRQHAYLTRYLDSLSTRDEMATPKDFLGWLMNIRQWELSGEIPVESGA